MTIDEMIELLKERNLVSNMDYQGLVGLFGQNDVDKLSPEDLEIAYTIKNVGNMTFEQLQAEIQKVKDSANEIAISPLSISQTIDQLNTRLKPAMDSLHSAWQDMFNDDGKFDLKSVDILSTCDAIKSKLDEMSDPEGLNLDVDYSAFEDFVRVLNNTESTEHDVENAFDSLATSITQAALSGAEDFETMKAALEDLGVVNNEMVAFQALASNTEMLEQALDEANVSMDDFIVNTRDGSVEATKAGQAFLEEKVGAENCAEALNLLAFHKQLCNLQEMNTAGEVANLRTLAENAGYTGEVIQYLTELEQIYQEVASGTLDSFQISARVVRATALKAMIEGAASKVQYAPKTDWSGAVKDAGKAGKDSGKSYKDKLKEELSDLEGVISGITGRIDDQINTIKSQKEIAVAAIDAQIDALNEQKSALEAQKKLLEEERDARIEIIEQQKKQLELAIKNIDKQIKEKEKIISGIQDEIKAMQDANAERQRQIDLQKALYDLERLQHQRTILQYSEEKGMHYVADTKGIRDAKDKVDDARLEIEIANKQKQIDLIEKEIDLLNEKKDAINEQIDILDEQIDQINEFYDAQIKAIDSQIESIDKQIDALQKQKEETEKYYESLIENLEKSKSKYEELTDIVKQAELSAALKGMGIDEEALLNGSEEEFEKLKNAYLDIVFKLNEGNDEVLSSLKELSGYDGTAPSVLAESTDKLAEMNGQLDTSGQNISGVNTSLSDTASKTGEVSANVADMNANLSEVSSLVTEEQTAFDGLKLKIGEVITAINEKAAAVQAGQAISTVAIAAEIMNLLMLKEKIVEVKESLGEINTAVSTMDVTAVNNLTTSF